MQLSAGEVRGFLDANLNSVSPNWTARFTRLMQRSLAILNLMLAVRVVFLVGVLFGSKIHRTRWRDGIKTFKTSVTYQLNQQ